MLVRIYKKLLAIEVMIKAMVPGQSEDMLNENKSLKAELKEVNKLNGSLKGELTKLKKKMKEVN
jgi:hypothetical protein